MDYLKRTRSYVVVNTSFASLWLLLLLLAGCHEPDMAAREEVELRLIGSMVEVFHVSQERYPDSLAELAELVPDASEIAIDVWGTPIQYVPSGKIVTLRSAGPDCMFNTADDIFLSSNSESSSWDTSSVSESSPAKRTSKR